MKNLFLEAVYRYDTYTENGAISHSTSGSYLLDYFSKCGTYRNRKEAHVYADLSRMWQESVKITLQIIFYNRLITRAEKGFLETEEVQKGQGNRSEFRKSIGWLARYHPDVLSRNLWLVPVAGSWKDLWHAELIDLLDHRAVYALIKRGLDEDYNRDLLAKYLPRIRSRSNTYNERHEKLNAFAHGLCKYLGWSPRDYRAFKSKGKAHRFQQQMCANEWDQLNFNRIPGKALFQLTVKPGADGYTTFQRHQIEDLYLEWIKKQPVAKFTGYMYELMRAVRVNMSLAQKYTIDKQFEGLLALARKDRGGVRENMWCALDTSGSMQAAVAGTTAFDICISLGIYFSSLNEGAFRDHVILFDDVSRLLRLSGSFSGKAQQLLTANTAWGSTNFQSVIDEIVRIRSTRPDIPLRDYPTTLLVVSDMQFNPAKGNARTNYEAAMDKLQLAGLPKMRIIWWWVTGRKQDFPSKMDDEDVVMIGGFDGSVITLLTGGEAQQPAAPGLQRKKANPFDYMLMALNQEILRAVRI